MTSPSRPKLESMPGIVYGPMKSRRHGVSLGVNLGARDQKTCTWGCVYCQCGHGRRENLQQHLDTIPSPDEVLAAIEEALRRNPEIDCLTFAGNTEPTSHPAFAEIVARVISLKSATHAKWLVKCLSNGWGLRDPAVTTACNQLDEIWIKLDCAEQDLFRRLNRPEQDSLDLEAHLARMRGLKHLRIQTMLWGSTLSGKAGNIKPEHLAALLHAYEDLRPLEVHLATIEREVPTPGLTCASPLLLQHFANRIEQLGIKANYYPSRVE